MLVVKDYLPSATFVVLDLGIWEDAGHVSQNLCVRIVVAADLEAKGLAGVDGETLATRHVERPMILVHRGAVIVPLFGFNLGLTKLGDQLLHRNIVDEAGPAGAVGLGLVKGLVVFADTHRIYLVEGRLDNGLRIVKHKIEKKKGGRFYPTPQLATTTLTNFPRPLSQGRGNALEGRVLAWLGVASDLQEGLGFAILLIGILLQSDRELHPHEGTDEVEELATLGEIELGAVDHLHSGSDDELVKPPIDGILVEKVVLDGAVLGVLEHDKGLLEPLRRHLLLHALDGDDVIAFFGEPFRTVAGGEVYFELAHGIFLLVFLVGCLVSLLGSDKVS